MVGPRLLDDGRGCEELFELFEDFLALVVPDEFFTFSEQLNDRPRPLGQAGDKSERAVSRPRSCCTSFTLFGLLMLSMA